MSRTAGGRLIRWSAMLLVALGMSTPAFSANPKPATDQLQLNALSDSAVVFSASGSGGSGAPPPCNAPTVKVSPNTITITRGNAATFSWTSTNATSAQLVGVGGRPINGSETVTPMTTTTYTIQVSNACGSNSDSATVTVNNPPPAAPATYTLAGDAEVGATGQRIAGATITDGPNSTTTASNGTFQFTGILAGSTHTLCFSYPTHVAPCQTFTNVQADNHSIVFSAAPKPPPSHHVDVLATWPDKSAASVPVQIVQGSVVKASGTTHAGPYMLSDGDYTLVVNPPAGVAVLSGAGAFKLLSDMTLSVALNHMPTGSLNLSPLTGPATLTVTGNIFNSDADGGTIVGWDCGNGTSGAGPVVTCVYPAAGVYTFTATIRDNQGAVITLKQMITVDAAPPPPPAPVNQAPTLSLAYPANQQLDATGQVQATITVAIADDHLPNPPGALTTSCTAKTGSDTVQRIDATTYRVTLMGTGSRTVLCQVTDGALSVSRNANFVVTAAPPLPSPQVTITGRVVWDASAPTPNARVNGAQVQFHASTFGLPPIFQQISTDSQGVYTVTVSRPGSGLQGPQSWLGQITPTVAQATVSPLVQSVRIDSSSPDMLTMQDFVAHFTAPSPPVDKPPTLTLTANPASLVFATPNVSSLITVSHIVDEDPSLVTVSCAAVDGPQQFTVTKLSTPPLTWKAIFYQGHATKPYTITCTAVDKANQKTPASVTVMVQLPAPVQRFITGRVVWGQGTMGVANATVQLFGVSALLQSTQTDTAGAFSFYGAFANGTYPVQASMPQPGIATMRPVQQTVTITATSPDFVALTAPFRAFPLAPTISPNGGTFQDSVSVTLAAKVAFDEDIHYTLDGTTSTCASASYQGPPFKLTLTRTTTVKAVVCLAGGDAVSPVATAAFTITATAANKPPVVQFVSPHDGQAFTTRDTIAIKFTAADPDGTIADAYYWFTPPSGAFLPVIHATEGTFKPADLQVGTYHITAKAIDDKGEAASVTIAFTITAADVPPVDHPPTFNLPAPPASLVFVSPSVSSLITVDKLVDEDPALVRVGCLAAAGPTEFPVSKLTTPPLTWRAVFYQGSATTPYTITCTAIDKLNQKTSASVTVPVAPPTDPLPTARFTVNRTAGFSPLTVQVYASASTGKTLTYAWDCGNGTTATGVKAACTYPTSRVDPYDLTLTVTDANQKTATASRAITVLASTRTLTGRVLWALGTPNAGKGLDGVTITLQASAAPVPTHTVRTANGGLYSIPGVPLTGYTLTPTLDQVAFTPASQVVLLTRTSPEPVPVGDILAKPLSPSSNQPAKPPTSPPVSDPGCVLTAPATVAPGASATATVNCGTLTTSAWVGLFEPQESNNTRYVRFGYVRHNLATFSAPRLTGSETHHAYDLRLFKQGYNAAARTPLVVAATTTVPPPPTSGPGDGCSADGAATPPINRSSAGPLLNFSAIPTTVTAGQSVTFSWNSVGAVSCECFGGQGTSWPGACAMRGTLTITPPSTDAYTLKCTGSNGISSTKSADIRVDATTTHQTQIARLTSILLGGLQRYKASDPAQRSQQLAALRAIAKERAGHLTALLDEDPAAFLKSALPAETVAHFPPEMRNDIEAYRTENGIIQVQVADDFAGNQSRTEYVLQNAGGTAWVLHLASQLMPALSPGDSLQVTGVSIGSEMAVSDAVHSYRTIRTAAASSDTEGEQRTIAVLVNFQNNPSRPFSQQDVQSSFQQVDAYYRENSYQRVSFNTTVTDWLTLPKEPDGCPSPSDATFVQQVINLADPQVVFTNYDRLVIMLPYNAACGSANKEGQGVITGKQTYVTADGPARFTVALTVEFNEWMVIAHELGHNLGLSHAHGIHCWKGSCEVREYGNPYDIMGGEGTFPPSNFVSGFGHFNAVFKEQLGWLSPGNVLTVNAAQGGRYPIAPLERPTSSVQALKVCRDATASYCLYVENRAQVGVLVNQPGPTLLAVDLARGNFSLPVGQTFVDPSSGITLTHEAGTGEAQYVRVGVKTGDVVPPMVKISSPAFGADVTDHVNVTIEATDADSGIARVSLLIDGQLRQSWTSRPYVFSWDTTQDAVGNHRLRAEATDRNGNSAYDWEDVNVQRKDDFRTVWGRVVHPDGTGAADVRVVIAKHQVGLINEMQTDAAGVYRFPYMLKGFSYDVVPVLQGYSVNPELQTIDVADADVQVPDFIASAVPSLPLLLTAKPSTILQGEASTISWYLQREALFCRVPEVYPADQEWNGFKASTDGWHTQVVHPKEVGRHYYNLDCFSDGSMLSQSTTVNVIANAPDPSSPPQSGPPCH